MRLAIFLTQVIRFLFLARGFRDFVPPVVDGLGLLMAREALTWGALVGAGMA